VVVTWRGCKDRVAGGPGWTSSVAVPRTVTPSPRPTVPVTVWRPAMVAVQVSVRAVQEPSGAMVKAVEPVASKELPWASVPVAR
jgi:hypothetical protein